MFYFIKLDRLYIVKKTKRIFRTPLIIKEVTDHDYKIITYNYHKLSIYESFKEKLTNKMIELMN